MLTVYLDFEGVIFVDFLQNGATITGACYANLITKLCVGGSCTKDFSCFRIMHPVTGPPLQQLQSIKQASISWAFAIFSRVSSNTDVIYEGKLEILAHSCGKCVNLKRDNVEKYKRYMPIFCCKWVRGEAKGSAFLRQSNIFLKVSISLVLSCRNKINYDSSIHDITLLKRVLRLIEFLLYSK